MFLSFLQYITPVTYPAAGLIGSFGAYSVLGSNLIFGSSKEEVVTHAEESEVKEVVVDTTSAKALDAKVTEMIKRMNADVGVFNEYINNLDSFLVKFRTEKYDIQVKISELEMERFSVITKKTMMFDELHRNLSRPEELMRKIENSREHLAEYEKNKAANAKALKETKKSLKKQLAAFKEVSEEADNLAKAIIVYNNDTTWREKNVTLSSTRLNFELRKLGIQEQIEKQKVEENEKKLNDLKVLNKQHTTSIEAVKTLIKTHENTATNIEKQFDEVISKNVEMMEHITSIDEALTSYKEQLSVVDSVIAKKSAIKFSLSQIVSALQTSNTEGKDLSEQVKEQNSEA